MKPSQTKSILVMRFTSGIAPLHRVQYIQCVFALEAVTRSAGPYNKQPEHLDVGVNLTGAVCPRRYRLTSAAKPNERQLRV